MLRPTVSRPVSLGIKHSSGVYDQIFITVKTFAGLLVWGALSDGRTGLSFAITAGARQRSHSRVQVSWDSRPYFTVPDSRLCSSPPTTRRATMKVFDPASTRAPLIIRGEPNTDHHLEQFIYYSVPVRFHGYVF
jgi:hypothetical protein